MPYSNLGETTASRRSGTSSLHVKNFDSAATAYNTNGDMSSHTVSLTSGYDILGYGWNSTAGGRLGHNSGAAIDGMVVHRDGYYERKTAWFLPNGQQPDTGHGHAPHTFPISNPDGLNMIGIKDATLDVSVTGLTSNQPHTITFRAASLQGVNRGLPLIGGQYAPSGTGTTVSLSWVGLHQAAAPIDTLTPAIMVSGNTTAAFSTYTYTLTPDVTSGLLRFYAAPLPGMSTNSGNGAFITNIQVTAPSAPQQTDGEPLFAFSNNELNLVRIKGGQNVSASSDNYGVLTVDLDTTPTDADYANLAAGRLYIDTQNGHVLKMKPN